MITSYKFFKNAFAVDGDKTAIPDATQLSGDVSYQQGFGEDYQKDLTTDPNAKAFPRLQFNQFCNDVTLALKQYQTFGVPLFISSAMNGGSPYSYDIDALVVYTDGKIYQSLANTNTALPTDATKWRLLDQDGRSLIYDNATFKNDVVDDEVVYWSTANTRFEKAIADGTEKQNVVGIADVTNKRVFAAGYIPGLTGLTPGAIYYLSTVTAGQMTTVRPLYNIIYLGLAKSATEMFLNIFYYPPRKVIAASVWRDIVLTLAASTSTGPIAFNQTEFNTGISWATPYFTADQDGLYEISARMYALSVGGAAGVVIMGIELNSGGGISKRLDEKALATSSPITLNGVTRMVLTAGDTLDLVCGNQSSGTVDLSGGNLIQNEFQIEYLGPAV